MSPPTNNWW